MMHNPWKVRAILLGGLALVACTLFAQSVWLVVTLIVSAILVFAWGLKEAFTDPYDLKELDHLQDRFSHLNPAASVICPHCGQEYPSRRSVCPDCLRSP